MAKVFIEETTLSAIGDAIRTKTETTELINPADMAEKIEGIITGGNTAELTITSNGTYTAPEGIDGYTPITVNVPQDGAPSAEELTLTGNCTSRFNYGGWDWFINKYGNQITTKDITDASYMFEGSKMKEIPFSLNFKQGVFVDTDNVFYGCASLKVIPNFNNLRVVSLDSLFYGCNMLREIPDNFCDTWDWSYLDNQTSSYSCDSNNMFADCWSLRKFPKELIGHSNPAIRYNAAIQKRGFNSCYALDEVVDLIIANKTPYTSNSFDSTFYYCSRLKKITFKMNEDGTPVIVSWKSQTIDLTNYVGYVSNSTNILNTNSGITEDTRITDDATYQVLKDNEDNWTTNYNYSRYNKTSAIETIATLPDASAYLTANGGTNTIKFKGAAGALTDGGAINTMTEEEIAVATAKGWTVSFV